MTDKEMFDERQLQIRGNIFKNSFIIAIFTLIINAFLNGYGIVWADGFQQNILLVIFLFTVFTVQSLIRGVFFDRLSRSGFVIAVFGVGMVVMATLTTRHFIDGAPLADEGMLTKDGYAAVYVALIGVNFIVGLIQYIRNKIQEKEN